MNDSFQHWQNMHYCYLCMEYVRADCLKHQIKEKHPDAFGNEWGIRKDIQRPIHTWWNTRKDQDKANKRTWTVEATDDEHRQGEKIQDERQKHIFLTTRIVKKRPAAM